MAEIQEGAIPKVATQADTDYIRKTNNAGVSESMLKSLFRWAITNITGLQPALDLKQNFTTLKSTLAFSKASGQTDGSGIEAKTISDLAGLNTAYNGFYTVVTPFQVAPMGNVQGVIAMSNDVIGETPSATSPKTSRQLVFTDLGIFFRVYAPSTWSNPMFVGGSPYNISDTRANLVAIANDSHLTPGTLYRITDHENDNGLVIQAATSSTFYSEGIRLGLVPAHYIAGTYDTNVWLGVWHAGLTPNTGEKVVYMGRVWTHSSGDDGNPGTTDGWNLSTNVWDLDTVESSASYNEEVFGVVYDLSTGYISKQWDNRGNVFGVPIEPVDGFLVEYNDWGNAFIYGNELKSCRNNISVDANTAIYNNNGEGDIHGNANSLIYENILTDENNNIRYNVSCTIFKNTLSNLADIDSNVNCPDISYNVVGADIKSNTVVTITYSTFNARIKDCNTLYVLKSVINGSVEDNVKVNLSNVVVEYSANLWNKTTATPYTISNSVLCISDTSSETYVANKYTRQDLHPLTDNSITIGKLTAWFSNAYARIVNVYTLKTDAVIPTDLHVTTGAGKTLILDTPVYCDINSAISSAKLPPANTPVWTAFTANTNSFAFRIDDYADLSTIEIPHSYKEGTDLEIHLHIATQGLNNATARKAKYIVYCTYGLPDNGANQFVAEFTLTAELTIAANQAALSSYYLSMGTVTGATMKIGTQFKMRIKRIAGTGTEPILDPYLGQVGIHFQIDTMGSRASNAK